MNDESRVSMENHQDIVAKGPYQSAFCMSGFICSTMQCYTFQLLFLPRSFYSCVHRIKEKDPFAKTTNHIIFIHIVPFLYLCSVDASLHLLKSSSSPLLPSASHRGIV